MEKISVTEIVRENKKNVEVFGVFMSEHINDGRSLRQFLAEERLEGRVPLRGEGSNYDPILDRVIVLVPHEWGADDPTELVGAEVRFSMIGTIPISDDTDDGKITVVRLTEASADAEPDVVFDDSWVVETAALCPLGRTTWVRLNPPPLTLGDDPDPDDDDSYNEGYL